MCFQDRGYVQSRCSVQILCGKKNTGMWVIAQSNSVDLIHMLEAALISEFHKHVGCRNKEGTGGDGVLNRDNPPPPPYYVYITGGRADQSCSVG